MSELQISLTPFLEEARNAGASDLHLGAGGVPFLRIEGELVRSRPIVVTP